MQDYKYTENKAFLPLVVATTFILLITLTPFELGKRIMLVSVAIWMMWLTLFLIEKRNGATIANKRGGVLLKLLFAVIISLFFANTIWLSGYLSLNNLLDMILKEKFHVDTLYHATVAESIKNYGYPSVLLNDAGFLKYHFGSHTIVAIMSNLLNIPILSIYNFLYPIICIPLYSYLLISVIVEIRRYKNMKMQLSVVDYIFLSFFFVGFLPDDILSENGIWKSSWIISESFLFAVICLLLYVFLLLKIIMKNYKWQDLLIVLLTSFFIVICSSMKVSVGLVLTAGVIYINFRKNTRKIHCWIANIIFIVMFIISYKIFSETMGENTIFHFLSFALHWVKDSYRYGYIIHYFILSFFTLFFLCYQLSSKMSIRKAILSKGIIIEETLVIVLILCLIPGLFLFIPGGSAGYFSYIPELIGVCALLGYNIPDKIKQKVQTRSIMHRNCVTVVLLFFSIIVYGNSKGLHSFVEVLNEGVYTIVEDEYEFTIPEHTIEYSILSNLNALNIPKKEKEMYAIFLDDSAEIWNYYQNWRNIAAIFFYPALTGIRVINGVYTDGKHIFTSNNYRLHKIEWSHYGLDKNIVTENVDGKINLVTKLTLDEAIEKARKKGFKYIIYIYEDKYQIIEL